ncbi:MAG: GntR family transcriptional regulator [Alphaproteobacteria bacterium]|nr:GntR family transcriptional regulator [Alphaproteobacteria bacterium]
MSYPATKAQLAGPPSASLGDWLTEVLKERIAGGGYLPGDWVREPALQREFGMSNGPVREALQNLIATGVLVREARRGVRVVDLSDAEVVELFQVRLALLELAAELAARVARPQDLRPARALLETIERTVRDRDIEALMPAGGALVDWVCRTTGNRQLVDAWERLTIKSRVYIYTSLKACPDLDRVGQLWRSLVEAIAGNEPQLARKAARLMFRRTIDDLGLDGGF